MQVSEEPLQFNVREITLAAKRWNKGARHKVLALHGWLDNAGSFDLLAPLMENCEVIAIDLAGQGMSDFRPPSASYHLWDDMVDIHLVLQQLGWPSAYFMGHSRGAILAMMYAAAFPKNVESLLLIDGLVPDTVTLEDTASQLAKFVKAFSASDAKRRFFATREDAIKARCLASGLPETVVNILARRSLHELDSEWFWRFDARLKAASAVKMTDEHNQKLLHAIEVPVSIVLAAQGMGAYEKVASLQASFQQFTWQPMQGHHHLHLDKEVQAVASCFNAFIQ